MHPRLEGPPNANLAPLASTQRDLLLSFASHVAERTSTSPSRGRTHAFNAQRDTGSNQWGSGWQTPLDMTRCVQCPEISRMCKKNRLRLSRNAYKYIQVLSSLCLEQVEGVCTICPAGTFAASVGSRECTSCGIGWYNPSPGQSSCQLCPNNKTTLNTGSTSASQCICPEDRFDPGTGECKPCGRCLLNEYVVSKCGNYSNVQCAVCDPCASTNMFVRPEVMCSGFENRTAQPCQDCRAGYQCEGTNSGNYNILYGCMSGTTSHDVGVCMRAEAYANPLEFRCQSGQYQVSGAGQPLNCG